MSDITLALASCGRHDLLERTLRSLARHESFPRTVIVEDGPRQAPAWLRELPQLGTVTWINAPKRMGQWWCVDRLYQEIKTEYFCHFEDDWLVNAPFVKESLAILEKFPEIFTVNLRGTHCNGHPLVADPKYPFKLLQPNYHHFGSFTLNPGVRRLSDYKRVGTFGKYCGYHTRGIHCEQVLGDLHANLGYLIASLPPDDKQIVEHLGHNRSEAKQVLPAPEKVLIAIPACHKYSYGQRTAAFHSDDQPSRIDAQRSTWLKDVKPHAAYVDYKIFYGSPSPSDFVPKSDEVLLNCGDAYEDLPHKVRAIYQWALDHGYSHVYKCDDDTYCSVDRLLLSDFRLYNQYGWGRPGLPGSNYITGGAGYVLSRAAMEAVVSEQPNHWAEDLWVGSVMRSRGLKRGTDSRFVPGFDAHYVDTAKLPDDFIACHAVKPEDMEKLCQSLPTSAKADTSQKSSPLGTLQSPDARSASTRRTAPTSRKSPHAEILRMESRKTQKDIKVKLSSGLGNQMFMWAFGQALAAQGSRVTYFFEDRHREFALKPYGIEVTAEQSPTTYKEHSLLYDEKAFDQPSGTVFEGCWQNEKYFASIAGKVREQFTQKFPYLEPLAEKLAAEESVAVGVRRGDYLLPHSAAFHGNLGNAYYSAAYAKIREQFPNAKFYVFSDDPDWCREHMEGTVLDGDHHEHLYLFSHCRHAIISNSTFHWWGAWLQGSDSVIAPQQWFRANVAIDIVPSRWITVPSGFL